MITPVPLPETDDLTWRTVTPDDLDAIEAHVRRCSAYDRLVSPPSRGDLQGQLSLPSLDLPTGSAAGLDSGGEIRALGFVVHRENDGTDKSIHLGAGVDPDLRGRGIGRALLDWQLEVAARMAERLRAASPGAVVTASRSIEDQVADAVRLVRRRGFAEERYFADMRRDISDVDPTRTHPPLPDGLALVRLSDEPGDGMEALRLAHNAAFAYHWGFTPYAEADWSAIFGTENDRPEMSFAIVDTRLEGRPMVAYAFNSEHRDAWEARGVREGYTDVLGTVRTHRGLGLASRLLELSADAFRTAGHDFAALDVDSDNPTGAYGLYERLGYVAFARHTVWQRPL